MMQTAPNAPTSTTLVRKPTNQFRQPRMMDNRPFDYVYGKFGSISHIIIN